MIPAQFDYLAPTSIEDALSALAEHGDEAKIIAGGQSLLPVLRLRLNAPEMVIDLGRIVFRVNVERVAGLVGWHGAIERQREVDRLLVGARRI